MAIKSLLLPKVRKRWHRASSHLRLENQMDFISAQAQGKLPLKFVPFQTSGNLAELQIGMTGLLLILVTMQI